MIPLSLKATYETSAVHDSWEAVYRGNALQDRLNSDILDRALALALPRSDAVFLDAGCGVGYHSLALASRGFRCIGVDISEEILRHARSNACRVSQSDRLSFRCEELERLSFADCTFDVVHCRGVLMHIPDWQKALGELCRVLKPGGSIILMESNQRAAEALLVRLVRKVHRPKSRLVVTKAGLEFWSEVNGNRFLVRMADLDCLADHLRANSVDKIQRFATELWDINRFPAGKIRNAVIRLNHWWFRRQLPGAFSIGIALVGRKSSNQEPHGKKEEATLFETAASLACK